MKPPRFFVGQKVVALKTLYDSLGKAGIGKGKVYTVIGIRNSQCLCPGWEIDIGIEEYGFLRCNLCGMDGTVPEYKWWFAENHFAPLMDDLSTTTIDEILANMPLAELITEPKIELQQ